MKKSNTVERIILNKIYYDNSNKSTYSNYFDSSSLLSLRRLADNPAFKPLPENNSFFGKIKTFIKRAIRKFTKFYIEPITNQQTTFNNEVVKVLEENKQTINNLNKKLNNISKENKELKDKLFELEKAIYEEEK